MTKIRDYLKIHRDKPYICCEYTHAMGTSNGGMFKYTDLTREEPLYQGGFIWDYIDQGLRVPNSANAPFAYGGDFCDRPTDWSFCCNGIVLADRTNSSKMQEVKFNYQNFTLNPTQKEITIQNESLFTSPSDFDLLLSLSKNGKILEQAHLQPWGAPGESCVLPIPFTVPKAPGEYVLTASLLTKEATSWAPIGFEIAFGQSVIQEIPSPVIHSGNVQIVDGTATIGIHGNNFTALFSRKKKNTDLLSL